MDPQDPSQLSERYRRRRSAVGYRLDHRHPWVVLQCANCGSEIKMKVKWVQSSVTCGACAEQHQLSAEHYATPKNPAESPLGRVAIGVARVVAPLTPVVGAVWGFIGFTRNLESDAAKPYLYLMLGSIFFLAIVGAAQLFRDGSIADGYEDLQDAGLIPSGRIGEHGFVYRDNIPRLLRRWESRRESRLR